jgi:hypothetical protein
MPPVCAAAAMPVLRGPKQLLSEHAHLHIISR